MFSAVDIGHGAGGSLHGVVMADLMRKTVTLNKKMEADLDKMFVDVPELSEGLEAVKGWAFCHAPVVKWPKLGTKPNRELQFILDRYYKEYRWQCYKRGMKQFGIVPWKTKEVGGWNVPVVPPVGSGEIRQYFDSSPDRECWVYEWYWYNRPNNEFDPEMRFKVWFPPDAQGNFTSPAVSILGAYKMWKLVTQAAGRIVHQASRMPYFMVHKPPKGKPGDEKLQINFGDEEEGDIERDRHNRALERAEMSRNAVMAAVDTSRAMNNGTYGGDTLPGFPQHAPLLNSESLLEIQAREEDDVLDRLVYLDDFWEPVAIPAPVMPVDPLVYATRLGQVAAAQVDFPLSMVIEQHAQHAGNFDAQITFARDRMKHIITELCSHLKDVMLDVESDRFHEMYYSACKSKAQEKEKTGGEKRKKAADAEECPPDGGGVKHNGSPLTDVELMELYSAVHGFVFEQLCTPLVTLEQVKELWEMCLMDQQGLAEEAFHLLGISPTRIKITPIKRPAELEMERLELDAKMGEKKLKLDEKVAKDKNAVDLKKAEQKPAAPKKAKK